MLPESNLRIASRLFKILVITKEIIIYILSKLAWRHFSNSLSTSKRARLIAARVIPKYSPSSSSLENWREKSIGCPLETRHQTRPFSVFLKLYFRKNNFLFLVRSSRPLGVTGTRLKKV